MYFNETCCYQPAPYGLLPLGVSLEPNDNARQSTDLQIQFVNFQFFAILGEQIDPTMTTPIFNICNFFPNYKLQLL